MLVGEALDAAKAGDRERAYRLARSAYLDHFEYVEIPLRLRNPNLVLDTEFKFAAAAQRHPRRRAASARPRDTADVRAGSLDVDRELATKGVAAPLVAFGFSFSILFREGIEAVLLIAILLGSLAAGSAANYKRPLALGRRRRGRRDRRCCCSLLTTLVIDIAPRQPRAARGGDRAARGRRARRRRASGSISRLEHRRRMEFMRARVASAMAAGTTRAFVGLGFTAVYREGFETVLFYQALALFAEGLGLWVVARRGRGRGRARRASPTRSSGSASSCRSSRC